MRINFKTVTVIGDSGVKYPSTVPRSATKAQILKIASAFYGVKMVAIVDDDKPKKEK